MGFPAFGFVGGRRVAYKMPKSLHILPRPGLKRVAGECALLEGNKEGWITCCSQRFFPLGKRISGNDSLAEDALQVSWIKILQAVNHTCFNGPKACPWVSTIIANSAKDVRRQRFRRVEVRLSEVEDPGQTPETAAQEKQLLALPAGDDFTPPGHLPSSCQFASVPGAFHSPDGTTPSCLPLECHDSAESSG